MQDGDNNKGAASEVWKSVHGGEYHHEVSSNGRIRSAFSKSIVRPFTSSNGYLSAPLGSKRGGKRALMSVHRVVARAFIGECPANMVCNHKDGDKHNNSASNLEYITQRENCTHSRISKGLVGASYKKANGKWASQMRIKGRITHLGYYSTESEAHNAYMVKLKELKEENKYAGAN